MPDGSLREPENRAGSQGQDCPRQEEDAGQDVEPDKDDRTQGAKTRYPGQGGAEKLLHVEKSDDGDQHGGNGQDKHDFDDGAAARFRCVHA